MRGVKGLALGVLWVFTLGLVAASAALTLGFLLRGWWAWALLQALATACAVALWGWADALDPYPYSRKVR